jgi:hypothetical protein
MRLEKSHVFFYNLGILAVLEIEKISLLLQQLIEGPVLHDSAVINHQNEIGTLH